MSTVRSFLENGYTQYNSRCDLQEIPSKQRVYFTMGAENVPGTLHKVPGHAVICGSVPGALRAPLP